MIATLLLHLPPQTATLASLNDALNPIGIRVSAPEGGVEGGQWSISDGKSLVRFQDGVVSEEERGGDVSTI